MAEMDARVLIPGEAEGELLDIDTPMSFWGGVDPKTGNVLYGSREGETLAGRMVIVSQPVGSSSSSAIFLELIRNRVAPAALFLGAVDAILPLGVVVAQELGYAGIPVLSMTTSQYEALRVATKCRVRRDGSVHFSLNGSVD